MLSFEPFALTGHGLLSLYSEPIDNSVALDHICYSPLYLRHFAQWSNMAPTLNHDKSTVNLDFYTVNVMALTTLNAGLSYLQQKRQKKKADISSGVQPNSIQPGDAGYEVFKKRFLQVYLCVFGADWLQVYQCPVIGIGRLSQGSGSLHLSHV